MQKSQYWKKKVKKNDNMHRKEHEKYLINKFNTFHEGINIENWGLKACLCILYTQWLNNLIKSSFEDILKHKGPGLLPKLVLIHQKQKKKKVLAKGSSPIQELKIGPHSRQHLLAQIYSPKDKARDAIPYSIWKIYIHLWRQGVAKA